MRNVFDQYEQSENRATHALATALGRDPALLSLFLSELLKVPHPPTKDLHISVQQIPGAGSTLADEPERRSGLPDFWVHDDGGWCVLFEVKIGATLTVDQIRRHVATAQRHGFEKITPVTITAFPSRIRLPTDCLQLEWKKIYTWLRRNARGSAWADIAAEYLEILEARMTETGKLTDGTLTEFSGIPFDGDHPFNYPEAKRLLKLAMIELRENKALCRELGVDPTLPGRSAITGRDQGSVWDYLQFRASRDHKFTTHPHLTLGIGAEKLNAMLTVPNKVETSVRTQLRKVDLDRFRELVHAVIRNAEPVADFEPGTAPWFIAVQRRYPNRSSPPIFDAHLEFDLRTAVTADSPSDVKLQPEWLRAAHQAFVHKNSNYQIQLGMVFPYRLCPAVRERDILNLIGGAWLALLPFVEVLMPTPQAS